MSEDSLGYKRPLIDDSTCIDCGLCSKQCIIVHPTETTAPISTSAAVRSDKDKIKLSSSGGVFAAIAEHLISKGWLVAGCIIDADLNPRHILTDDVKELRRMYGSNDVIEMSDARKSITFVFSCAQNGHFIPLALLSSS